MLDPMLTLLPPWLLITPLVGLINGSLFFVILGRKPSSLPVYVVLAVSAASAMQALQLIQPGGPPLSVGEVHLVATSLAAWVVMMVTRLVGA